MGCKYHHFRILNGCCGYIFKLPNSIIWKINYLHIKYNCTKFQACTSYRFALQKTHIPTFFYLCVTNTILELPWIKQITLLWLDIKTWDLLKLLFRLMMCYCNKTICSIFLKLTPHSNVSIWCRINDCVPYKTLKQIWKDSCGIVLASPSASQTRRLVSDFKACISMLEMLINQRWTLKINV